MPMPKPEAWRSRSTARSAGRCAAAGAPIALFSGRPFVVTLHGSGSAGRFSDLALAQRVPWLVRLLLCRARAVICCSEQLAAAMRDCGLRNVHAIPYGVDVPAHLGA